MSQDKKEIKELRPENRDDRVTRREAMKRIAVAGAVIAAPAALTACPGGGSSGSSYTSSVYTDAVYTSSAYIDVVYTSMVYVDAVYTSFVYIDMIYSSGIVYFDTVYTSLVYIDMIYSSLVYIDLYTSLPYLDFYPDFIFP